MNFSFRETTWDFKRLLLLLMIITVSNITIAQTWNPCGSAGFSAGEADFISSAVDGNGTPYVAYSDVVNRGAVTVMKFDGTNWLPVGRVGFTSGHVRYTSIAIDSSGTPYVAYADLDNRSEATVMKFDGSNWVVVGVQGFSTGPAYLTSIAIDRSGTPYVLYSDSVYSNKTTVVKFDGSNWVTVGNPGFSANPTSGTFIAIDKSGTPYVAYTGGTFVISGPAIVEKYDGSNWVNVGSPLFSAGQVSNITIAIDGSGIPYVSYSDIANGERATVMKYNGSNWVAVGLPGFSEAEAYYPAIALDAGGTPYVIYEDNGDTDRTTVMRYDGVHWVTEGVQGFSQATGGTWFTTIAISKTGKIFASYQDRGNADKATVMEYQTPVGVQSVVATSTVDLSVYPNPAKGSFNIKLSAPENENVSITIVNLLGEKQ